MTESSRNLIIAGNWKLNGSKDRNRDLVAGLLEGVSGDGEVDILVCPPYVYLDQVATLISGGLIALGAQDLSVESVPGAFTGEVAGTMLSDVGCDYVIVGHSERRTLYGEADAFVARKFCTAQRQSLIPILCVGESQEERETGRTEEVVRRQVETVLDEAGIDAFDNAVLAYEPIWAIGTGLTASPDQAQEVHSLIRAMVSARDATIAAGLRILYGGSVKGANARDLFSMDDIDGGLVGGASLTAQDFLAIYSAAQD